MNSFAQLTSMMTSSSTFFLLFLVIGYPGVVISDGPSVESCLSEALPQGLKEWTSDSSSQIIQVNWNFDKVCASVEKCYGNESSNVDFIKFNQLPPVQIQLDQSVLFRLEKTGVEMEYFRVSEVAFEGCDAQGSQPLDIANDTILGVANGKLTRGNNYFIANSPNGVLNWKCAPYGLRVNITVQPSDCSQGDLGSGGGQLCSGHGRCTARRYEPSYSCRCCPGFLGQYCEKQDGCFNVTCSSGGTCVDGSDDFGPPFTCNCIPGFKGTYCESLDGELCTSNECEHDGICLKTQSPPNNFRCICMPGFTGKVCETNIDECASSPCRSGSCVDLVTGYKCNCYKDYSGINCETYSGLCPAGRCKNGGTCETDPKNEVVICSCHPGYTGASCETKVDLCRSNPCINSIDCVDYGVNFKCVCIPGYTGARCDSNVDECASNPCQNDGTCHDHVAAFSCDCPEGLSQPTCTSPPDNSTGGSGNGAIDFVGLTIAVSVLGCLFGIALIVLLIYCCIVRKPYKLLRPKKYVHIVDETYGPASDVSGAHPSPDFVADPVTESATMSSGSAKSPLVRRVKHTEPSRI